MIHTALSAVTTELNDYVRHKMGWPADPPTAVLANLVSNAGTPVVNRVTVTLVNVQEERIGKSNLPYRELPDGRTVKANPELHLNLFVLISVNFDDTGENALSYKQSLTHLSHVIGFFQKKSVFTPSNTPTLPAELKKLILELEPIGFEHQSYMWGAIGAKYLPSVLYKMRLLHVQDDEFLSGQSEINIINHNLENIE